MLDYSLYTELAVGAGHPSLADTINRPLKSVLIASGLAIDVDPFPGFLPLAGGTRTITSLTLTDVLVLGATSNISVNTDKFTVNATSGNVGVGGTLVVAGGFGCNGSAAQTAYASGGVLEAYVAGANGFSTEAMASELYSLVVAIRAALVANGIMS